jgi:hypothetical protein
MGEVEEFKNVTIKKFIELWHILKEDNQRLVHSSVVLMTRQ